MRGVHPGSCCLAGKRFELPAPGRLGTVSEPHKRRNHLCAAVSKRAQGEMQKREVARGVGGQQRLEEKRQLPLRSFEVPSKNHRRYIEEPDRKSTRLNSSHLGISYAVF